MFRIASASFLVQLIVVLNASAAPTKPGLCERLLGPGNSGPRVEAFKAKTLKNILYGMAYAKGLPPYIKMIEESKLTESYKAYENFGEMGLAEIGISVRYNIERAEGLNTGRPLIIVANHHLGIADGLALQYLVSHIRKNAPSLLFLANWIDELMPFAVYDPKKPFGTAIPVEINEPEEDDPEYEVKSAKRHAINQKNGLKAARPAKRGSALIVFPAGHVAGMNPGGRYPANVYDLPNEWQDGYLNLARLADADIVFAYVDSVNSRWFYLFRKLFGGGDRERVIWFLGEALAKKGKAIDVYLSKPMSLDEIYDTFAQKYGHTREAIESDTLLTAELMRQFTYEVPKTTPQKLDRMDSPQKKVVVPNVEQ